MAYRYTIRRLDELTEPSKERGLSVTFTRLWTRLRDATTGPYRLEYDGEVHREWDSAWGASQRLRELMRREDGPDRIIIRTEIGPDYAVKKFKVDEEPVVENGPGTAGIDLIHAAVLDYCEQKGWRVTELGICVDKPGEHGHCNAWDGGCIYNKDGSQLAADEIHSRILNVAAFIREEGIKNQNGNGGLPINGVIVMSQYWERGMGATWRSYSGTAHVTHWHVSAHPSITGWI